MGSQTASGTPCPFFARKSPKGASKQGEKANEGKLPRTFCKSLSILLHPFTSLTLLLLTKTSFRGLIAAEER
jgi:hypothetical protein